VSQPEVKVSVVDTLSLPKPKTKLTSGNLWRNLRQKSTRSVILSRRRNRESSKSPYLFKKFKNREKERRLAEERLRKINEEQDVLRKKKEQ
jgi:hypothetical protein